jgi:predicted DNA-binding antitoxin AbrB/MazE fold protein
MGSTRWDSHGKPPQLVFLAAEPLLFHRGWNNFAQVRPDSVLKPLQPLGLAEHEHVSVTVIKTTLSSGSPQLDIAYLENLKAELLHAGPAPGTERFVGGCPKSPAQ